MTQTTASEKRDREQFVALIGEHLKRLDEILDFHEPDEDVKVQDIVADLDAPNPEEEADRILETARAALREKLLRAGCTVNVSHV
jgi:hypothetical protein